MQSFDPDEDLPTIVPDDDHGVQLDDDVVAVDAERFRAKFFDAMARLAA